jgi:hypothetical protein
MSAVRIIQFVFFQLLSLLGEARLLSGTIVAPRSRYGAIPLADELDMETASADWIDEGTVAYAGKQLTRSSNMLENHSKCDTIPQHKFHTYLMGRSRKPSCLVSRMNLFDTKRLSINARWQPISPHSNTGINRKSALQASR